MAGEYCWSLEALHLNTQKKYKALFDQKNLNLISFQLFQESKQEAHLTGTGLTL
jgi:hypothetical protein